MSASALVWFRNDLRVHDNNALAKAKANFETVYAVYIDTPRQDHIHDVAAIKIDFKQRNLKLLKQELQAQNIELIELALNVYQDVPPALLALVKERQCQEVVANREYAYNEIQRDKACANLLRDNGITLRLPHDQAIVAPGKVLTQQNQPYTVFTPFYRRWLDFLPDAIDLPTSQLSDGDARWPAGEGAAKHMLLRFANESISAYKALRDIPSVEGTSKISPYLASGVLSARACLQAARQQGFVPHQTADEGIETWVKELAWRDFYIHLLYHFPQVSLNRAFKPETEAIQWSSDHRAFKAWCEGRTGVPIVDAAMRQLVQTGWMHNRLRMVTAMFLTKHLLIDWRRGEKFFMQHLIDGHLASNNGGWQWAASTGTDAAPYFRVFNPVRQSEKFDPDGTFIRKYVPELSPIRGKMLHLPPEEQRQTYTPDYPKPIIDLAFGRNRAIEAFKALKEKP